MSARHTFQPRLEALEDRCVPATFRVTNLQDSPNPIPPFGTLQFAIVAANLTPAPDTIVFKAGLEGTIELVGFEILITTSLTVLGPGASRVAISGGFISRIFNVTGGLPGADLTVTLQGLELRNGKTAGDGGAILSEENLTLNRMVCTFNQANFGGAIRCVGELKVAKSTISGNTASVGGGISSGTPTPVSSVATITSSTISGNSASSVGGGIACNKTTITSSTISVNSAGDDGGGILCGTATITGSTISGNSSAGDGGGLSCNGDATITSSTISGNTAANGGGISLAPVYSNPSEIRNCTISGNRATLNGGGISSTAPATLNLRNCTIAFNQAGQSGGGMAISSSSPFLESCLVSDNAAGTSFQNLAALGGTDVFHLDHCLVFVLNGTEFQDFTDFTGTPIDSDSTGTNLFAPDPLLAPLAFNGGKTQTHALKKGSPAINHGGLSTVTGLPNLTFDQRGTPFKRKVGPAVDIGAFERQ